MSENINWQLKHFSELSTQELYSLLRLRNEVFIVEQNCPYQDLDNKDLDAWHLIAWLNNEPVACSRILKPHVSYKEASIGRVVTSGKVRGKHVGIELMKRSISYCNELFGNTAIRIGAQSYLQKWYGSLGFEVCSEEYMEDGIPHIEMIRKL